MTNSDTVKNKLLAFAVFVMEYRDAYYELCLHQITQTAVYNCLCNFCYVK